MKQEAFDRAKKLLDLINPILEAEGVGFDFETLKERLQKADCWEKLRGKLHNYPLFAQVDKTVMLEMMDDLEHPKPKDPLDALKEIIERSLVRTVVYAGEVWVSRGSLLMKIDQINEKPPNRHGDQK
jgi:hypothetical protein